MTLRSLVLVALSAVLPGCLVPEDRDDPPEPEVDVTIVTYRQNLVASSSSAGRLLAYSDENGAIHASLLGKRDFLLPDHESPLAVASDGTDHVLLVTDYDGHLLSRRVSDAGVHLISDEPKLAPYAASLMATGTGYLASWTTDRTGFVARLDASGGLIGGPWQVSAAGIVDRDLRVAVDSTGAAITWTHTYAFTEGPTSGKKFDLHLRRIAFDGALGPDIIRDQAVDAAIAGGDTGFVLTSITMDEAVVVQELDATLAPVGVPVTIADQREIGAGFSLAIAGQPGAYAVQYTSESGSVNGISGIGRSRVRVVDGTTVGVAIDLGVYITPVLTSFHGVFQSAWTQSRTVTTSPTSYESFDDLFQADLRTDGGTVAEL